MSADEAAAARREHITRQFFAELHATGAVFTLDALDAYLADRLGDEAKGADASGEARFRAGYKEARAEEEAHAVSADETTAARRKAVTRQFLAELDATGAFSTADETEVMAPVGSLQEVMALNRRHRWDSREWAVRADDLAEARFGADPHLRGLNWPTDHSWGLSEWAATCDLEELLRDWSRAEEEAAARNASMPAGRPYRSARLDEARKRGWPGIAAARVELAPYIARLAADEEESRMRRAYDALGEAERAEFDRSAKAAAKAERRAAKAAAKAERRAAKTSQP